MMLTELDEILSEYEVLAPHTWFNIGGPARWLARPHSIDDLVQLVRRCGEEDIPIYRLGQGANLLISDEGVEGMVVQLGSKSFREVEWSDFGAGETVFVRAGGGADMSRLSREAVHRGLAGIECMAGIPGSLGGIVRMNAGGKYGQIADTVRDVTIVEQSGRMRILSRDEIGFSYRHTSLHGAIVCGATLELRRDDPQRLRERFLEYWQYKKKSQPLADNSAGCVFKNPTGQSAGALIDRAGLKGKTIGGASVSTAHGNFIVAKEGATARDVMSLIRLIRQDVAERFGVELDLEIEVWGRHYARTPELAA